MVSTRSQSTRFVNKSRYGSLSNHRIGTKEVQAFVVGNTQLELNAEQMCQTTVCIRQADTSMLVSYVAVETGVRSPVEVRIAKLKLKFNRVT